MDTVVKIIGIAIIAFAIVYLLKPDVMKSLIEFFKQGKRMYFAALIRFALAVVFLLAARECKNFWVIFSFGILFLIAGLLIFILGLQKVKAYIEWWQKQSLLLIRILAIIPLALGVIIIICA